MGQLHSDQIHVKYMAAKPAFPCRYTITYQAKKGDVFLVISSEYIRKRRNAVFAEWKCQERQTGLHIYCHVKGGWIPGTAQKNYLVLLQILPLVLESIRMGDQALFQAHPELEEAPIFVHFRAKRADLNRVEEWGSLKTRIVKGE